MVAMSINIRKGLYCLSKRATVSNTDLVRKTSFILQSTKRWSSGIDKKQGSGIRMNRHAKKQLSKSWYGDSKDWLSPEERESKVIFGGYASEYDRYRPRYPTKVWNHVIEETSLQPGDFVADLGTGTGRGALALASLGYRVHGVDPDAQMIEQVLVSAQEGRVNNVSAAVGSSESTGMEDNSVDMVMSLQAFHWFEQDKTLAEIHRILKPGGHLAVVWYDRDLSSPWVNSMEEVIERYNPTYNRAMRQCDGWFEDDIDPFTLKSYLAIASEHPLPQGTDDVLNLAFTFSYVANAVDNSKHDAVRDDLRTALAQHEPITSLPLLYRVYILQLQD